ncbi:hypothetical protein PR048_008648 [Dryococelus australis]|uniref:Uncharacterized protein n=1 Tax=Dryococelus australis TaxID=614101 RepID=A0ABQ9HXQ8_9NEOP|nr:hypothetical protein PR048_008648 [Dryococelus australis]
MQHKAVPFPVLTVSDTYYKRILYYYNLGMHDLAADTCYFYVWDEIVASRSAWEVSSCLVKHLELNTRDKKNVIIYSDTCTGENRNIKMALSLMWLLVSGHSFLPNDSDFASVELAAKGKTIYVAVNWYDIMASCRQKKKFIVCQIQADEFYSTQPLEMYITRRRKMKISGSDTKKSSPFKIFYKEHLHDFVDFSVLDIKSIRKGRLIYSLCCIPKVKLYHKLRAITKMKRNDMIDLLLFIPPVYHTFFLDLNTTENLTCQFADTQVSVVALQTKIEELVAGQSNQVTKAEELRECFELLETLEQHISEIFERMRHLKAPMKDKELAEIIVAQLLLRYQDRWPDRPFTNLNDFRHQILKIYQTERQKSTITRDFEQLVVTRLSPNSEPEELFEMYPEPEQMQYHLTGYWHGKRFSPGYQRSKAHDTLPQPNAYVHSDGTVYIFPSNDQANGHCQPKTPPHDRSDQYH